MSVKSTTSTGTCGYCSDEYLIANSVKGSYCSTECYHKHRGEKALNTFRWDHRKCSTCGRIRAEVEPPKPDEGFAVDGQAYDSAWHVEDGVVHYESFGQDESAEAAIGFRTATVNEEEGCVCGTLERTGDGHFDVLHNVETFQTLLRVHKRIKEAAIDGQREDWPSKAALFRNLRESNDLAYSVGKAL